MTAPELAIVGDIGATNMRIGVYSMDGQVELSMVPTPHDPDQFFHVLGNRIENLTKTYPSVNIAAIGFPGKVVIHPEGIKVSITNIAAIKEPFDVTERVAAENENLNGFRILALNDAEAATHAAPNVLDDGHDPEEIVTYITQSSGVGGDSIRNGVISSRADCQLAEYGHIPLRQPDGGYVTLEKLVSGDAIRDLYGNGTRSTQDLYRDTSTSHIWEAVGRDLGRGLGILVPLIGMRDIVIGGGTSNCHPRYKASFMNEFEAAVAAIPTKVVERAPNITFVPKDEIDILGLKGAFLAVRRRYQEFA